MQYKGSPVMLLFSGDTFVLFNSLSYIKLALLVIYMFYIIIFTFVLGYRQNHV